MELNRTLLFCESLFKGLKNDKMTSSTEIARDAYNEVIAPHSAWIVNNMVMGFLVTLPSKPVS